MIYLDAGTTYSKILTVSEAINGLEPIRVDGEKRYYILNSALIKGMNLDITSACGHMSNANENEIIALAKGAKSLKDIMLDNEVTVLDLGSRDAKWVRFKDGKFHDMDWNTSCASSTGATVEMLLKFYNLPREELSFNPEKFAVTCGIFGLEKIMDDISNGVDSKDAISKFVHGIAYNSWNFAKKPNRIYLSGGFCENKCFVDSLKNYCDVHLLGRFVLCEGLMNE